MPFLKRITVQALFGAAAMLPVSMTLAQSYTVLHSFSGADGQNPVSSLILGSDGNLYGTTANGGACPSPNGCGTIFKMDAAGNVTTLHSFGLSDGTFPGASLIQASDGSFYGTTASGGTGGSGTVFRMDPSGSVTTLHSFNGTDGANPYAALIQDSDGNLYGTTLFGGTGGRCPAYGCGTVFKLDSSGNLTSLHSFNGSDDGEWPQAGLLQASDGKFYGATSYGAGLYGNPNPAAGTIFQMDSSGNLVTLNIFGCYGYGSCDSGAGPKSNLIQAPDGSFYGTTSGGGTGNSGTVFKMNANGGVITLHSFGGDDGSNPVGLVLGGDGNLYGTTSGGGGNCVPPACGTVFRMYPTGNLITLHRFGGPPADGAAPSGLIQAPDGNLYGTTARGGTTGDGVVFRLATNVACPLNAETLCLDSGRFLVQTQWTDFQGNSGLASVASGVSSNSSGVMWFFGPDNWELLIKVLDGCAVNGHYWVFGAAATNVGYTIQVTDTQTGQVRTYTNPLGTTSPAITDTAAFSACP